MSRVGVLQNGLSRLSTPWKTNMDPENHWLVEENTLPGGPGRQG